MLGRSRHRVGRSRAARTGRLLVPVTVILLSVVTPALPASAQIAGKTRFVIIGGEPRTVKASGAINSTGIDVVLTVEENPDGTFRLGEVFTFPEGELFVTIQGTQTRTFDPRRCVIRGGSQGGVLTITGGTGRYAGASGQGKSNFRALLVAPRDAAGNCIVTAQPVRGFFYVVATADVFVP